MPTPNLMEVTLTILHNARLTSGQVLNFKIKYMKKVIAIFILFSMVLTSCKTGILDIAPQDRVAELAVWADESLIKAYHNSLYNAIPHGFYIHMFSKYTDEAYNSVPCCGADIFKLNTFTPDNIGSAVGEIFGVGTYITGSMATKT